jgi:hypothetical protein
MPLVRMQPIRKAICGIEGADRNKIVPVVARDAAHVQQAHDRNLWVSTISIWPLQHKDLSHDHTELTSLCPDGFFFLSSVRS